RLPCGTDCQEMAVSAQGKPALGRHRSAHLHQPLEASIKRCELAIHLLCGGIIGHHCFFKIGVIAYSLAQIAPTHPHDIFRELWNPTNALISSPTDFVVNAVRTVLALSCQSQIRAPIIKGVATGMIHKFLREPHYLTVHKNATPANLAA